MFTQDHNATSSSAHGQQEVIENQLHHRDFNMTFFIANIFTTILTISGFFIVKFTDTVQPRISNLTEYCNDPIYNISPIPKLNYSTAYAVTLMNFILLVTAQNSKKYTLKQLIKKILWFIWILGQHSMFLFIFIEFLKCAVGTPRPYFFSMQELRNVYCGKVVNEKLMTPSLEELTNELLKSFPSYRSAVYAFSITFLFFYIDHFNTRYRAYTFQEIVILTVGSCLTHTQISAWEDGENHVSDIFAGFVIGIIQATITIRDMFGSVFYTPNIITPARPSIVPLRSTQVTTSRIR